jgi:trehalose synthase
MPDLVEIAPHDPARFESVLSKEAFAELAEGVKTARDLLADRVVWNVNSTAKGGGVVELLIPLLGYANGAGVDARWAVIKGDQDFFTVTKRIHNHLHGFEGDGGPLGDDEHAAYEKALEESAEDLAGAISPGDVVLLHDPQTAGLVKAMKEAGACVIWRCHVGLDRPNDIARGAWDFLQPYVVDADAYVFSREAFAWEGLDESKIALIAPTIDAFSAKNQDLEPDNVAGILAAAGIFDDGAGGDVVHPR